MLDGPLALDVSQRRADIAVMEMQRGVVDNAAETINQMTFERFNPKLTRLLRDQSKDARLANQPLRVGPRRLTLQTDCLN